MIKHSQKPTDTGHVDNLQTERVGGERDAAFKILEEQHTRAVRAFDVRSRNVHLILPPEHATHQQLEHVLKDAARMLGIAPDQVNLCIFSQYPHVWHPSQIQSSEAAEFFTPQAFINPQSGTVYINPAMLDALHYQAPLIHSVMYHELAHMLLMRDLRTELMQSRADPLGQQMNRYEVEYHCDRIAALLSSRRGEEPSSIGTALRMLNAAQEKVLEQITSNVKLLHRFDFPMLSSHPTTTRRLRANDHVAHQIPVARSPQNNIATVQPVDIKELLATKELDVTRPSGPLVVAKNSFGNEIQKELSGSMEEFLLDRPRSHFLSPQQYTDWCARWCDEEAPDEYPPPTLAELLTDASPERISDWVREFALLIQSGDQLTPDVVEEFQAEIQELSVDSLSVLLRNLNYARIVDNTETYNIDALGDSCAPFCLSLIANRYIQLQKEQGATSLDSLRDLVEKHRSQENEFGIGVIQSVPEIPFLALDICQRGSEEEHRALVNLIDHNRDLYATLILPTYLDSAFTEPLPKNASILTQTTWHIAPLLAKYSPLLKIRHDLPRQHNLSQISMCAEISPLNSDGRLTAPILIRRVPGGNFAVKNLPHSGSAPIITLIEIGDAAPQQSELETIREMVAAQFKGRFEADPTEGAPLEPLLKIIDDIMTKVNGRWSELLELPAVSDDERKRSLQESFVETTNTPVSISNGIDVFSREISTSSLAASYEASDIHRAIYVHGEDETKAEWIGPRRSLHSRTLYTRAEANSFEIFQHSLIFNDLYGAEFRALPTGPEKAEFLLTNYPIKTLARDQLLCAALAYPALSCLDDMKHVEQSILSENDIRVLHLVRDGLKNQALAQAAEVRLYSLCQENQEQFLAHPSIVGLRTRILDPLPEVTRELVMNNEALLGVLSAYTQPSRERDNNLRQFIDKANSKPLKEALGLLLVDPIISQTSNILGSHSRASTDSVFAFIKHFSPFDKAQALLYFMRAGGFHSPIARWFSDPDHYHSTLSEVESELPLRVKKVKGYDLPDCLVRAQKAFGITMSTAETLHSSVLNERSIIDLLHEFIFGENGIASEKRRLDEFCKAAGETLVQTSDHLRGLPPEQQKNISRFVAYAFMHCPSAKLPRVIMRVWEASKSDQKHLPTVLTGILSGLGPAFVKFGQKIATRDIPQDYRVAFRRLSSQNQEIDSTLFYHNCAAIYGRDVFDESKSGRKLAEGSMASTYTAVPIGEDTPRAVKIIHPFIGREIIEDCDYIRKLVEFINSKRPFGTLSLPTNTADVVAQQLRRQIDSILEVNNSRALAADLSKGTPHVHFTTPEIDSSLSVDGIIVASYRPGYELDDQEIDRQGFDSKTLKNDVGLEVIRLLMTGKVFQSDVNLGNFGVLKEPTSGKIIAPDGIPTVAWYDAGAVEPISGEEQKLLLSVIKSAATKPAELPSLLVKMIKDSDDIASNGESTISDLCASLANSWKTETPVTADTLKERFEQFLDAVSASGLVIEERWLIIANTIAMTAPLLEGVSSERFQTLLVGALKHHNMLSHTEKLALKVRSWF